MELASAVFEAELVAPKRAIALRLEVDAPLDLVVRRKADGEEIVRTPAELESPGILLATVQNDLLTMTPEEFIAEWRMPPEKL
jgi:hypothetical protein